MKLKSVKIQNFKSFGNINNRLDIDDINTIIGKNESGKSNLIECLSNINFFGVMDTNFFKKFNKNTSEYPCIGMVLEPFNNEKQKYGISGETKLIFSSQYDIEISGELTKIIENDQLFQNYRKKINELKFDILRSPFLDQNLRENFNKLIEMINNVENKLFINYPYVKTLTDKIYKNTTHEEFSQCLKYCISFLNDLKSMLPIFVSVENLSLKSQYTKKYLEDSKESKKMLLHLLNCMNFSFEKLMEYWKLSSVADKMNFDAEFNSRLDNVIEKFNNFYKQEKVEMRAIFEHDSLNFVVKTTKKYMDFNERSNGLKWYLNMYIQILSKTNSTDMKNYVILIDEPGVYLHVNAQKEVLDLFEDFSEKSNQIIYTTHSPFMIYKDKIYRTRTIIKDGDGNSNISNKYYSLPHKMGSKTETLTPLLVALGMNMNHNILVFNSEKTNIITEGISDYNYIKSYYKTKEIVDTPNIIPSVGVSNIHNIVSILIGWGCKIKIILDQDIAGREQYNVLINKLLIDSKDIIFSDGTNEPNNSVNKTIEDNFSDDIKKEVGVMNQDYDDEKAFYSLEALKRVENNELKYDIQTISNFEKIINQLVD